jgi:hypothetical protein
VTFSLIVSLYQFLCKLVDVAPPVLKHHFVPLQVYLWHGTPVRQGLAIAQDDFKISLAGSGNGSMFGEGFWNIYLGFAV